MKKAMKKTVLKLLAATFAVMFVLPFIPALTSSDPSFDYTLLMYLVSPGYSIFIGIFSGRTVRKLWFFPLLSSVLALAAYMILFGPSILFFIGCYFLLGMSAMGTTALILVFLKIRKESK